MSLARSSTTKTGLKPTSYGRFGGLDTSRDVTNMDSRQLLNFTTLDNGYVDWRGQLVRDPGFRLGRPSARVRHVRFFNENEYALVYQDNSGFYGFDTTRGHKLIDAYPDSANPTSFVFNRDAYFLAEGQTPYRYTGSLWLPSEGMAKLKPAFGAVVSRRACVAGMRANPTRIEISRVDKDLFADREVPTENNPLRAGFIDVQNLLTRPDRITGLAQFEQDRLAVFTQGRTLLYRISPDLNEWQLDERANIKLGCISHNTVCDAGTDLLFCSRNGIHSVQRTSEAGILVYSRSISDQVDILYRRLLRTVADPSHVTAVFDQDEARYRVFFPSPTGNFSQCLSVAINPEGGETSPQWSTCSYLNATCGDFFAGKLVLGGIDGAYEVLHMEDEGGSTPILVAQTPMLWLGSFFDVKNTHSLVVQAAGSGTITIEAEDDKGRRFFDKTIEVDGDDGDDSFADVPLAQQYDIPFQFQVRGCRLKFTCKGDGAFRLFGFAVLHRS